MHYADEYALVFDIFCTMQVPSSSSSNLYPGFS